ncbi:TetR/AcrR family transcriptional regulator [Actinomadura sp. ATCC 39365]
MTLREVGARAGVTRGAPYRHFSDKDSLLTTIAAEALDRLADQTWCSLPSSGIPTSARTARTLFPP